jgi:hypothetical protein
MSFTSSSVSISTRVRSASLSTPASQSREKGPPHVLHEERDYQHARAL